MKKILIILVLVILFIIPQLVSCSKKDIKDAEGKPVQIELVGNTDISWLLRRENGIDVDVVYGDNQYAVVGEEWFVREVIGGFDEFLKRNGIESYTLNNDCDDFARAFSFYSRVKFRQLGYDKASMAVGDFYYRTPYDDSALLGGGHAMNIGVFLDKNGKRVVKLIEPQLPVRVYPLNHLDEETLKYYIQHIGM